MNCRGQKWFDETKFANMVHPNTRLINISRPKQKSAILQKKF